MRNGFTLVEVVVALVLFQFGMLALAAAGAVAARDLTVARNGARARAIAQNRVELLRASACFNSGSGTVAHPNGFLEHWRSATSGPKRIISDSVVYPVPLGQSANVVIVTATICAP
jgi:Tfp pilus assembly protein PilV